MFLSLKKSRVLKTIDHLHEAFYVEVDLAQEFNRFRDVQTVLTYSIGVIANFCMTLQSCTSTLHRAAYWIGDWKILRIISTIKRSKAPLSLSLSHIQQDQTRTNQPPWLQTQDRHSSTLMDDSSLLSTSKILLVVISNRASCR